jgi:DNA-binding transcriptional regulator of glucitol operon
VGVAQARRLDHAGSVQLLHGQAVDHSQDGFSGRPDADCDDDRARLGSIARAVGQMTRREVIPMTTKLIGMFLMLAILAMPGCGERFASDKEELDYLSSLSNPSATQWKRKNELAAKQIAAELKRDEENRELNEQMAKVSAAKEAAEQAARQKVLVAQEKAESRARAMAKAKQDDIDVTFLLGKAEELDRESKYDRSLLYYRDVVEKYPDDPRAKHAAERIKAIEAK